MRGNYRTGGSDLGLQDRGLPNVDSLTTASVRAGSVLLKNADVNGSPALPLNADKLRKVRSSVSDQAYICYALCIAVLFLYADKLRKVCNLPLKPLSCIYSGLLHCCALISVP